MTDMDKLQPIIKNRFWILAGLVVPLAMYGFFSANSKLKAATTARETELKGVLSNIPGGTNDPNEEYAAGLQKINDVNSFQESNNNSFVGEVSMAETKAAWGIDIGQAGLKALKVQSCPLYMTRSYYGCRKDWSPSNAKVELNQICVKS
ncbi:hypothetical protein OAF42_03980 [Planctomicrobium sp.]|nr:hypothetical protein [Planctomicrobium sp.]MDB4733583.1 hypothetical protein [Planctomicrobium sp.]